MSNRFFGALVALLMTLLIAFGAHGQSLNTSKPWVSSDVASGGLPVVEQYVAQHFGIGGLGFSTLAGPRMGHPIQCGTWDYSTSIVKPPYILPSSVQVVCRDRFTGTGVNLALAVTPKITIPATHHSTRDGSMLLRLHEYLADWADGRAPTSGFSTPASRAAPGVAFDSCKQIPYAQPSDVIVFEWSVCRHLAGLNPHWTAVAGFEAPSVPNTVFYVLYGTAGGVYGQTGMQESVFLDSFYRLIKNVRYVSPGS